MKQQKQAGFTLIELMLVVIIIAVLAAVAMNSYTSSVQRSNRNEARSVLIENQLWMEQRYAVNNSYILPTAPAAPAFTQSPKGGTAKYNIAFVGTPTATTYTLRATPVSSKIDGDACKEMTIDQTGLKTVGSGAKLSLDECWNGK